MSWKTVSRNSITSLFILAIFYFVYRVVWQSVGIWLFVGVAVVILVGALVYWKLTSGPSTPTASATATTTTASSGSSSKSKPGGISPGLVAFGFIVVVITMARLQNITPAGVWERYSSSPKYPQCGGTYVVTATTEGSPEVIRPPKCRMRYSAEDTMDVYVVMTPFDTLTAGPNYTIAHKSLPQVSFRSLKGTIKIGVDLIPK